MGYYFVSVFLLIFVFVVTETRKELSCKGPKRKFLPKPWGRDGSYFFAVFGVKGRLRKGKSQVIPPTLSLFQGNTIALCQKELLL